MSDLPEKGKFDEGLGAYLRRHREGSGISLELLSAITKIKVKSLEAMEEGHFVGLPSEPILRGFLRSYAAEVGLDVSQILRRYESSSGHRATGIALPEWSDRTVAPPSPRRRKVVLGLWFLLAAGVLSLFITGGWQKMMGAITASPRQEATAPGEVKGPAVEDKEGSGPRAPLEGTVSPVAPEEESASVVQDSLSVSAAGESENGASEARLEVSVGESQLTLTVTAIEDTWLRVVVDGVEQDEVLLPKGLSRNWKGREEFALTVGNTAGTRVELNGLAIKLPQTGSNIVRDFLVSKKDLP